MRGYRSGSYEYMVGGEEPDVGGVLLVLVIVALVVLVARLLRLVLLVLVLWTIFVFVILGTTVEVVGVVASVLVHLNLL